MKLRVCTFYKYENYDNQGESSPDTTLKMTSAQVVETSVKITSNSPSQDYTLPDYHNLRTYDKTPGFGPFTDLCTFSRKAMSVEQTVDIE